MLNVWDHRVWFTTHHYVFGLMDRLINHGYDKFLPCNIDTERIYLLAFHSLISSWPRYWTLMGPDKSSDQHIATIADPFQISCMDWTIWIIFVLLNLADLKSLLYSTYFNLPSPQFGRRENVLNIIFTHVAPQNRWYPKNFWGPGRWFSRFTGPQLVMGCYPYYTSCETHSRLSTRSTHRVSQCLFMSCLTYFFWHS